MQNEVFQDIIERLQKVLIQNQFKQTASQISPDDLFEKLSATHYPEEMKAYILSKKKNKGTVQRAWMDMESL